MSGLEGVLNEIMADFKKKIEDVIPTIPPKIATDLEPEFKKIISTAIDGFYYFPQGKFYKRTGNFNSVKDSVRVYGTSSSLVIYVGEDTMSSYPGMFNQPLDASTAFDYFYMNGEHGHGKWNIGYSYSPDKYVEDQSGYIETLIGNSIGEILNSLI